MTFRERPRAAGRALGWGPSLSISAATDHLGRDPTLRPALLWGRKQLQGPGCQDRGRKGLIVRWGPSAFMG